MHARRDFRKFFSALCAALMAVAVSPAPSLAVELCQQAPNFKAYEVVQEEDFDFHAYRKGSVTLFWIWDWAKECPV
ncbi:MAG: hypothetical protein HYZ11_01715 [Candidatus Tectomicrobia bacterium]|uniref:Redoxin domain-containing protein n=1 Tax=Tectimicrobiota bacterium TaxID=2528274 RepID=A0A932HWI0_UNCTE|nr:hypothetical protein [Candidatus Tectomicrobia bacterium]